MTDRRPTGRGRRWRLFPLLLVFSIPLPAQEAACPGPVRWRSPQVARVLSSYVAHDRRGFLTFGPSMWDYRRGPRPGSGERVAGFWFAHDGAVTPIAIPPGMAALENVVPFAVDRDEHRVLWSEGVPGRTGPNGYELHRLIGARLRGAALVHAETIATVEMPLGPVPSMASGLVTHRGAHFLGFAVHTPGRPFGASVLALLTDEGGPWRVETVELPMMDVYAVDLRSHEGQLVALFSGVPPGFASMVPEGAIYHMTPWISRRTGSGWSPPLQVDAGQRGSAALVRLLVSNGTLIASWYRRQLGRLEWRSVGRDGTVGALRSLDGVVYTARARAPFDDVLVTIMQDGAAHLLRLAPDGHEDLGALPTIEMATPALAMVEGRPWAFGVEMDSTTSWRIRTVGWDITCMLGREGVRGRR